MQLDMNAETLEALRLEVLDLQDDYDEKWVTGLRHCVLGQPEEADTMLDELASIERALTYIKAYLHSNYAQAATVH
ncbi:MAG: hypothetical protein ACTHMB_09710 [Candidatus Binatia bacterium]